MASWVLVVGLVLAGCLQNNLTPCGEQLCPAGKACHEPSGGCFGPDQIEACDGRSDFEACEFGGISGFCIDNICLVPRCGDGFVQDEINEACDLGDAVNSDLPDAECRKNCQPGRCGDGVVDPAREEICDEGEANGVAGGSCAIDCGSDQTCGNGIQDVGETCDDENDSARDGCSGCQLERLVAQPLTTSSPRSRARFAMAFDAARERTVVFGGKSNAGGLRGDTLEWDGFRWREVKPLVSPSARQGHAAGYDSTRHRVLVFGGDDGAVQADLWQFDGAIWKDISPADPAARPPARTNHAMAYDPIRDRLVVFGGRGATDRLGDTWVWDGTARTWTELTPPTSPPPTENASMVFDPTRGEIVLFGGRTGDSPVVLSNLTWIWNGTTWSNPTVAVPPTAREHVMMAFDAAHARVVMATGRLANNSFSTQVFAWDGATSSWTTNPGFFNFADGPAMAYDSVRRHLVAVGSQSQFSFTLLRRFDTLNWSGPPALATPPARIHAAGAWDARRGRLVMVGGSIADGTTATAAETWEWDGSQWIPRVGSSPEGRRRAVMTYSNRDGIVLTGGTDVFDDADLWSWNGVNGTWSQLDQNDPLLGLRYSSGLAYDAARDTLLLAAGLGFGNSEDDIFQWNPGTATWSQAAPMFEGARHNFAMAYDPVREYTLLVGGKNVFNGQLDGAVSFDGAAYASRPDPGGQRAKGTRLVFDPFRRRMVALFDPEDTGLQIWDYDGGMEWEARDPQPPLGPLYRPTAVFDPIRAEIVLFSGRPGASGAELTNATVAIGYQPNLAVEACTYAELDYDGDLLPGCMDPDCFGRCTPLCAPGTDCAIAGPTCGDTVCNAPLEDCKLCPADCGACADNECGDFRCDGGETPTTCPGDCIPPVAS